MGKFDGYLICTDMDDTMLTTDKRVSEKDICAINNFMDEGGIFTIATGRVPLGMKQTIKYVRPNAPVVCFNGGAIYDFNEQKYLCQSTLEDGAGEIIDYVEGLFDFVGTEIITVDNFYFHKTTKRILEHAKFERITGIEAGWREIKEPWMKIMFMQEADEVELIREAIAKTDYDKKYNFVKTSPFYYEVLPKNATKGDAALKICEMMGIDKKHAFGIGDNENDISLIEKLGVGAAVANATDTVKQYADFIAPHHNNNPISWLISEIEEKYL